MSYTFDLSGRPIASGTPPGEPTPAQLGPGVKTTITNGTVSTITAESGASRLELIVESGNVRVRSDGSAPTATTGEPMWPNERRAWAVTSLWVLADGEDAVVTTISR